MKYEEAKEQLAALKAEFEKRCIALSKTFSKLVFKKSSSKSKYNSPYSRSY
jgi:hypothetical protein